MKRHYAKRFCAWAAAVLIAGMVQPVLTPVLAQEKAAPPVVSPAYILQPGDEVSISVLSVPSMSEIGAIAPDGILYLKNAGEVRAAGLTIPQLETQIRSELAKKLKKPAAKVSLTKLAPPLPPNKITIVGSVMKPGPQDLEKDLRVAKAIENAGGALKDADLSKVVLIHRDLSRLPLDLSSPERISDPKQNVELKDGDSVYIPAIPAIVMLTVTVNGAVSKPGPVQVEDPTRAYKVIELSGGVTREADLAKVTIRHKDLTATSVDLSTPERVADPKHNPTLQDGDSIEIPAVEQIVSIEGAVTNSGVYELKPGWTLIDLIKQAGLLTRVANFRQLQLHRKGASVQTIDAEKQLKAGETPLVLKAGDRIVVPEEPNQVWIVGSIAEAGFRPFKKGQTITQFLRDRSSNAASVFDSAKVDLGKVQLVRGDEPARKFSLKELLKNPKHKDNFELESGDTLIFSGKEPKSANPITPFAGLLGVLANIIAF